MRWNLIKPKSLILVSINSFSFTKNSLIENYSRWDQVWWVWSYSLMGVLGYSDDLPRTKYEKEWITYLFQYTFGSLNEHERCGNQNISSTKMIIWLSKREGVWTWIIHEEITLFWEVWEKSTQITTSLKPHQLRHQPVMRNTWIWKKLMGFESNLSKTCFFQFTILPNREHLWKIKREKDEGVNKLWKNLMKSNTDNLSLPFTQIID